jgi:hypothetical protein
MVLERLGDSKCMLRVLSRHDSQVRDFKARIHSQVLKSFSVVLGHLGSFIVARHDDGRVETGRCLDTQGFLRTSAHEIAAL